MHNNSILGTKCEIIDYYKLFDPPEKDAWSNIEKK